MKLTRSKLVKTLRKLNNGKTVYQARKIANVSVRRVYQVKEAFDKTGKIPEIWEIRQINYFLYLQFVSLISANLYL